MVVGEGEVVAGVEPAVIGGTEARKWPDFDHVVLLGLFVPGQHGPCRLSR